ncbi:adhesin [Cereibacter sphaeroides]|uniref:VCBS domain-containing protein n=1 Tax=Cereibacter sphaeroides TaxID=1063 RepID=UPI000F52D141|nr:VCBS domain-containing protein [Cereibacter sphaeroides]AZB57764.1 adhesin [Cereibacter sphaeroides]AZB61727.1 adhesin [Cereibacter sphaeroides]
MPTVNLTSALTFSEGGVPQLVDPNITITGGGAFTEGYIEFSVSSPTAGDNFSLTSAANPLANGAISFENGDVYLGTGSARERIGSVDATFDGQDGQPLRILFSSPLPNAGFEEGEANWTIRDEQYGDNGSELNLDGLQITLANDSAYSGGTGTTNVQASAGMTWDGSVQDGAGVDGSRALYLGSGGNIVAGDQNPAGSYQVNGYGSIHGPYATSSVITVAQGDSISLDFQAVGTSDDYEVFGFLRRVDANGNFLSNSVSSPDNILLFAQRGDDTGGWTTISKDGLPAGSYRFEFVGGTYDGTGGLAVGSNLFVDNIRLISATSVNDSIAQAIARQVAYQNDANDAPVTRQITVTAVDGNGISGSSSNGLTFEGENDAPSLANTTLTSIAEDSSPAGQTIAAAFGGSFSDPDNAYSPTDSMAGVVITGNAATGAQGDWQYSTDGGTTWISVGSVTSQSGLVLSSATLIRFEPALNWNGTPGALTLHALDSTYGGSFTSGTTAVNLDTTGATGTGALSQNSATGSITVTPVNDAPVFTAAPVALTVADTEAVDTPAALTGSISASDLHGGAPGEGGTLSYGVQGGVSANGFSVLTLPYGTLSVNQSTGAYSFAPNPTALNSLAEGAEANFSFTLTVSDGQGGTQTAPLDITFTGANDVPVVSAQIGTAVESSGLNNNVAGSAATGSLLTGPNAATDIDGDEISVVGVRTGGQSETGTEGVWTDGTITLQGTYGTLTLNEDGSWSYAADDDNPTVDGLTGPTDTLEETFTYTVTDSNGATASQELTVTISGRNDALNVSSSIGTDISTGEDADTQIDLTGLVFEDPDLGSEIYEFAVDAGQGTLWTEGVDGLTVTGNGTGQLVLTGSATAISEWIAANDLTYRSPVEGSGADTISLSYSEAGAEVRTALESIDVAVDMINDPAVVDVNGSVTTQGSAGVAEVAQITFLSTGTAQVLNFDGVQMQIAAGSTAAEIAEAFAAQEFPNWTVSLDGEGRVTLTATATGSRPDLTAADFTNGSGAFSPLVETTGGTDGSINFTARGPAIAILPTLELSDVDSAMMSGAKVSMTEGLFDNGFGTIYERLSLSAEAREFAQQNGVGISIVTTAAAGSVITFTGMASAEVYETILRGVIYSNTNPNAVAGTRPVKIEVTDSDGLASSLSSVNLTEGNTDIAVGQRIFINGVDSGQVVSMVRDATSFVASGPLADLEPGAVLSFHDGSGQQTTAVSAGDGTATMDVNVIWAPVIDMNGAGAGDIHRTTYIEQHAPIAIATADARIVDQEGLIRSLDVVLTNPLDNVEGSAPVEYLGISKAVLDVLAARGITIGAHDGQFDANGNLTGATSITFAAANGASATSFQIALRGVTYANMDDAPDTGTRIVTAQGTDMDGNEGLISHTEINPIAVGDAPVAIDSGVTGSEDAGHVFAAGDFGFADPLDGGANQLASITINSLPATGTLLLGGVAVAVGTVVTLAQLQAGALTYQPVANVNGEGVASFDFLVTDNGSLANGGQTTSTAPATMVIDLTPVNDAPVLPEGTSVTGTTITEDQQLNAGELVADLVGAMTDVDTGVHSATNGTQQGIAVYGAGSEGFGGGTWQYRLAGGTDWIDVTLDPGEVLLLGADDRIRFSPDGENATEAQLSYYAWDGATGTAGSVVAGIAGPGNASNRGGTSAFSSNGASATVEVTAVNDAPSISMGEGNTFYARGEAVALFSDETLQLTDPDEGAAVSQIVITLDGETTVDNAFGTTYETIFSASGSTFVAQSGTELTISGTGVAGDPLTISGAGSMEDYREALLSLRYENTNPNAFAGDRAISVTVTDETGADSAPTDFILPVEWATVADLNGPSGEGRDHSITYLEGSGSQAIATADAEMIDQDGNTVEVVITLEDAVNGSAEMLFVDPAVLPALAALNIVVTGNGTHEIRLTSEEGVDPTNFQLALRAVRYVNSSTAPTAAERHVTVSSTDADGNPGVPATTVIGMELVNDAPVADLSISYEASETRNPLSGDQLLLDGTLDDADGLGPNPPVIEWLRDGVVIASGNGMPVYTLKPADAGHVISARITYTDGEGNLEVINVDGPAMVGLNLEGTDGADLLIGSRGADVISGRMFNDTLMGGAGNDKLFGNGDDDRLYGNEGNDSLYGEEGNDWLHGGQGDDLVVGGDGNDTLAGGLGNDTLQGGAGNDTASYETATEGVTVSLVLQGEGQLVNVQEGYDLLTSIENLTGSRYNDTLIGDGGDNVLSGLAGNDVLVGGAGNDTLLGGEGNDIADYSAATGGVTVNLARDGLAQVIGADQGIDVLSSIEGVIGSASNDILSGSAVANLIFGGDGADVITGAAGNDTILGGAGSDSLYGNIGDDLLYGDVGSDWIHGGQGNDTVLGGAGDDTLAGGVGDDVVDGGDGIDTVEFQTATAGVTVDLSLQGQAQRISAEEGMDTLFSIENILGSRYDDRLLGDAGSNLIDGSAGNDTAMGQAGEDLIFGGDGNDSLYGNQDNDTLVGGNGNDWLHGGQGNDLLVGDAGSDTLNGGVGDDVLVGGQGFDLLTGGTGADTFVFGSLDSADADRITDFEQGVDQIVIADQLMWALENAELNLADQIVWNAETGMLSIDLDAGEATRLVDLAQIDHDGTLNITIDDFQFLR